MEVKQDSCQLKSEVESELTKVRHFGNYLVCFILTHFQEPPQEGISSNLEGKLSESSASQVGLSPMGSSPLGSYPLGLSPLGLTVFCLSFLVWCILVLSGLLFCIFLPYPITFDNRSFVRGRSLPEMKIINIKINLCPNFLPWVCLPWV